LPHWLQYILWIALF